MINPTITLCLTNNPNFQVWHWWVTNAWIVLIIQCISVSFKDIISEVGRWCIFTHATVAIIEKLRSFGGAVAAFWVSHFEFPTMPPIEALRKAPSRCQGKSIEKNGPMAVSWQWWPNGVVMLVNRSDLVCSTKLMNYMTIYVSMMSEWNWLFISSKPWLLVDLQWTNSLSPSNA